MQIAKFMVDVCLKSGTPITNIKLQAAMYRVQRTFLKNGQGRAFFEDIEAWVFKNRGTYKKMYVGKTGRGQKHMQMVLGIIE